MDSFPRQYPKVSLEDGSHCGASGMLGWGGSTCPSLPQPPLPRPAFPSPWTSWSVSPFSSLTDSVISGFSKCCDCRCLRACRFPVLEYHSPLSLSTRIPLIFYSSVLPVKFFLGSFLTLSSESLSAVVECKSLSTMGWTWGARISHCWGIVLLSHSSHLQLMCLPWAMSLQMFWDSGFWLSLSGIRGGEPFWRNCHLYFHVLAVQTFFWIINQEDKILLHNPVCRHMCKRTQEFSFIKLFYSSWEALLYFVFCFIICSALFFKILISIH